MNIIYKLSLSTLLFFFSIITLTLAQPSVEWDRTFGGKSWETLNASVKTEDEGFLLCGSSSSPQSGDVSEDSYGSSDFWIVRIDSTGNKLWDKRYGGTLSETCFKVLQNTEGYLLIGDSYSSPSGNKTAASKGDADIWIVQIRPDGTKVWDKTLGGSGLDKAYNAVKLADGSYIISAESNSPADGDKSQASNKGGRYGLDLWIIRIDKNGNIIWDKTFGGDGDEDTPTALIATNDGNFMVACGSGSGSSGDRTESLRGVKDFWILKFSADGKKIWDKRFGGEEDDSPYDIQELKDGSLVIGGNSRSSAVGDKKSPNYGEADYWLIKIDKNGNKIWDKTYGGTSNDYMVGIDQNKVGYILVAGQSISLPSGNKQDSLKSLFDMWLLYLDENGKIIWEKTIGGDRNDVPFELVRFKDGNYLVCGLSSSNVSFDKTEDNRAKNESVEELRYSNDMWVVKINCFSDLDIGNDTLVCKLEPVTLDAQIPNCRNCLYEWNTGANTSVVVVKPQKTTRYSVKVTFNNACEIKDNVDIVIIPPPDTVAYIVNPPRCRDGNDGVIAVDSIKGGTPPYSLVFQGDTLRQKIFIDKLRPGNYPIVLLDKNNCKITSSITVPNPLPFNLYMTPSQEVALGDSFRLFAVANKPIDTFFWSNRNIKTLDAYIKPFDSETFSLTAIDELGCIQTGATQITVRRENLYFAPNVFSPNADNKNDYYQIFGGKTVESIDDLKIYSRWGEMMFETKRIFPAVETEGWDGRFNGNPVLPGVYVFTAEVKYIDGRKERIKGEFTLLR